MQVITNEGSSYTRRPSSRLPPLPLTGLDGQFPYDGDTFSIPQNNVAKTNDSPGVTLKGGGETEWNSTFETYYMAQPLSPTGAPDGIWVPIASITWSIKGTATWNNNPVVNPNSAGFSSSFNGGTFTNGGKKFYNFGATTKFPEWTGVVVWKNRLWRPTRIGPRNRVSYGLMKETLMELNTFHFSGFGAVGGLHSGSPATHSCALRC